MQKISEENPVFLNWNLLYRRMQISVSKAELANKVNFKSHATTTCNPSIK